MSPPTDQVTPHCCDIAAGNFRISLVPLLLGRAVEYSTRQYKAHPLTPGVDTCSPLPTSASYRVKEDGGEAQGACSH
jgi:hypothetical protein